MSNTTVIIGAGAGGLAAAIVLAARGHDVTVLEAQSGPGGKLLPRLVDGASFDTGPTVLTMRWVFESLFESAGDHLDSNLTLEPQDILARHVWTGGHTLDLFADQEQTEAAIAAFAGLHEAAGYRKFAAASRRIHDALREPFLKSQRPTPWGLAAKMGMSDVLGINPFDTLWHALGRYFKDKRLMQLFGRYATYCGTSPFKAPATLMLVADVEAQGVWRVKGGMGALAQALEQRASRSGASFLYGRSARKIETVGSNITAVIDNQGIRHPCRSVIINADTQAVAGGFFGETAKSVCSPLSPSDRSLSAITWCAKASSSGTALVHHNVFFSNDYPAEFSALARGPAPDPTVYLCDQGEDRKLLLINAPANGQPASKETGAHMLRRLSLSGLELDWQDSKAFRRDALDFAELYPATYGALYGRASNGWMSTFQRPQARTRIPGLYLAGGSTHPGPGVPMAALAGIRAAEALLQDRSSTRR